MNPPIISAMAGAVDRISGVIRRVSVITTGEALGHGMFIDGTTLEQVTVAAAAFQAGVKVKMNHTTDFESIVGVLRDFAVDGDRVRADLYLFKSHPRFSAILELAETIPDTFGLSISFSGPLETIDGKNFVRCAELYSVDLVDRPAANPTGLFNRVDSKPNSEMTIEEFKDMFKRAFGAAKPEEASLENKPTEMDVKLSELATKITALEASLNEAEAKFSQSAADLATAKQTISTLEGRVTEATDKSEKLAADLAAAQAVLSDPSGEIEKRASAKALEITAAQGQAAPLAAAPKENPNLPEKPALKGLAKVTAAFAASIAPAK